MNKSPCLRTDINHPPPPPRINKAGHIVVIQFSNATNCEVL